MATLLPLGKALSNGSLARASKAFVSVGGEEEAALLVIFEIGEHPVGQGRCLAQPAWGRPVAACSSSSPWTRNA